MARKSSPRSSSTGAAADRAGADGADRDALRQARREAQAAARGAGRGTEKAERQIEAGPTPAEDGAGPDGSAEAKASLVERAVGAVDEALQAHLAEQQRRADRAARHAAKLDRLAGYRAALDVWTRSEPGERKPRFTRDEIAQTAIRIADTEGFDALSMRRLAAELGAGTMTLYHYVRTKDELMTLVNDAIMGEVALPPGEVLPSGWRNAVTVVAERSRAALQRHPWVLDLADDPPVGPNGVRHFEQSLQAVSSLDVDLRTRLDIVALVDEYVFGFCLGERIEAASEDGPIPREMKDYVASLLGTGEYPQIQALADELGLDRAWDVIASHRHDAGRFDRGLRRILDGVEAHLPPSS